MNLSFGIPSSTVQLGQCLVDDMRIFRRDYTVANVKELFTIAVPPAHHRRAAEKDSQGLVGSVYRGVDSPSRFSEK
jgi:hypothetical protein